MCSINSRIQIIIDVNLIYLIHGLSSIIYYIRFDLDAYTLMTHIIHLSYHIYIPSNLYTLIIHIIHCFILFQKILKFDLFNQSVFDVEEAYYMTKMSTVRKTLYYLFLNILLSS